MSEKPERLAPSAAVERVLYEISIDTERSKVGDRSESLVLLDKAAGNLGYGNPYRPEQIAMNKILADQLVDGVNAEKAWKLYHQLTSYS